MLELTKRLSRLQIAANASARRTQVVHLFFVLVCAYIGITLAATTHEHLLRDAGISLPGLGIAVPTLCVFLVMPWVVVLLHCALLLQIKLLSSTLTALDHCVIELQTAARRREQRELLYPSLLVQLLLGLNSGTWIARLYFVMVFATVCALPLLLLAWTLLKFVPYHHTTATWLLRMALFADLGLLWWVWGDVLRNRPGVRRKLLSQWWRGYVTPATDAAVGFLVAFVALAIAVVPGERLEGLTRWRHLNWIFHTTDRMFPRSLDVTGRPLVAVLPAPELIAAYYSRGEDPENAWRDHARGLDLRGRDLRMSNFAYARLDNADLRNADLNGANFSGAVLRGATFAGGMAHQSVGPTRSDGIPSATTDPAQLERATLQSAGLEDVALDGVALVGADLTRARLHGAAMNHAILRGAVLTEAELDGASLVQVDFSGADLRYAHLQGANLALADLRGADLAHADLRGADLHGARLDAANLHGTLLRAADLRDVSLRSACYRSTDLSLSDLRGAELVPLSAEEQQTTLSEMMRQHTASDTDGEADTRSDEELVEDTAHLDGRTQDAVQRLRQILAQGCAGIPRNEITATSAIYDRSGALAEWPAPLEQAAYGRELVAYLAGLSCSNARVAKALVWQFDPAQARFHLKTTLTEHLSALPAEILDRHCAATESLAPDIRRALQEARVDRPPPATNPTRLARLSAPASAAAGRDRKRRGR